MATLNVGDSLVYVTKTSKVHREGRRLVAVLRLVQAFGSHADAAIWYRANEVRLPYSCIVPGSDPLPITMTNPKMTAGTARFTDSKLWDRAVYAPRAKNCVKCFASTALFLRLDTPPVVKDEYWNQTLGSDPGQRTQNVGLSLEPKMFEALMDHTGVDLP
jgi:hypothetical protein